jgi:hypothetical protein
MPRISKFLTGVLRSHLGHMLLAVSLSFILFVIMRGPLNYPQFVDCTPVGDEIYTITEVLRVYPVWIVVIGMAHFPSMLATMGATKLFQAGFSLSCAATAKVELPFFALFSAIQWLLVGYIIEKLFRQARSRGQNAPNKSLDASGGGREKIPGRYRCRY